MADDIEDDRAARRRNPEEARAGVEEWYPRSSSRRAALDLLAFCIEQANAISNEVWGTTLRRNKINLNIGKVMALGLQPEKVWVSLATQALRAEDKAALEAANAERDPNGNFKLVPGAAIYCIEPSDLEGLRPHIEPAFLTFAESAAKTAKTVMFPGKHSPGVLQYLDAELGKKLPRPAYAPPDESLPLAARPAPPKAVAVVLPRVQFTERRFDVDELLKYIELGDIALPDIQRPFVWKGTKVRDLFDSMYRGYPVGSLMLWSTVDGGSPRSIGGGEKRRAASLLVVDGQQRLTSLFSVLRGKPVLNDSFEEVRLFEVQQLRQRDAEGLRQLQQRADLRVGDAVLQLLNALPA